MNTVGRVCPEYQTPKQKRDALRAITLIKEKRFVKIKGRECADGRSQRAYITKEEEAGPTISMEALLGHLMIDTFEQCEMALFDVPGAYLNADMPEDKFVLLKLDYEFLFVHE